MDPLRQGPIPPTGPAGLLTLVDRLCLYVAMGSVVLMGLIIVITIVGRWLVGRGIPDDVAFVQDLMVVCVTLPLAAVTSDRSHIAVEVFTNWLPQKVRSVLELVGLAIGIVAFGLLAFGAWLLFVEAWTTGSYYDGDFEIPHWPAKLACLIGFGAMTVRLVLLAISDIVNPRAMRDQEV